MAAVTFDTLKFANRLKQAGVPDRQAEAEVLAEALQVNLKDVVTKEDLRASIIVERSQEVNVMGSFKSDIVAEIPRACQNEAAAVEFMEEHRWGDHPACPRCGSEDVYQMRDSKTGRRQSNFRWHCRDCAKIKGQPSQYTVRIGTVFEDSRIELRHWCYAFWRASTSKKGAAALEIARQTELSYKSALFMMHRIRYAMAEEPSPLDGTVEVDEAYIGGKPRYKGKNKRGRGTKKQPIVALVERNGRVRSHTIANVSAKTLKKAIRETVGRSARIVTDENPAYIGIGKEFAGGHQAVNHGRREYVRGDVHSNTAESFFAIIKRGMYGIYHNVSREHLHRYLSHAELHS
jgi:transposase-like protein